MTYIGNRLGPAFGPLTVDFSISSFRTLRDVVDDFFTLSIFAVELAVVCHPALADGYGMLGKMCSRLTVYMATSCLPALGHCLFAFDQAVTLARPLTVNLSIGSVPTLGDVFGTLLNRRGVKFAGCLEKGVRLINWDFSFGGLTMSASRAQKAAPHQ